MEEPSRRCCRRFTIDVDEDAERAVRLSGSWGFTPVPTDNQAESVGGKTGLADLGWYRFSG